MGALYLACIIAVPASSGWLLHDWWQRTTNPPQPPARPAQPPTIRVIPPVPDWKERHWA